MTECKVDIDRAGCPPLWRVEWVLRVLALHPVWLLYQRSRRGWHLHIMVRERLGPVEVVAVQAVLGSDCNRETYNLARARMVVDGTLPRRWRWNLLFDRKVVR